MAGAQRPTNTPEPPELELVDESVEQRIMGALPWHDTPGELSRYYELLREYPSRGGKRIRARITLLSTLAHGGRWGAGLTAAAAIELFQNWVLIHDDVEDDSDERRGQPTLHRQIGVPLAVNVGDGLHAYMWQLLLDDNELPREVLSEFLWLIHRTSEGQHLDLSWVASGRFDVEEEEYLEMVRLKTACYTVVSPLRLGALCAQHEPNILLEEAGEALGVAFQIRDDVLNLTRGAQHGKEFAGDLFEGKRTLILAHFFSQAGSGARLEAVERLSSARARRTKGDVEALLAMLLEHGSVAYAQQVAESRAAHGVALLGEALAQAEDLGAVARLTELLESLASRSS
ncbi:MAG: polyprenyl synthetase family protein [Trueperaceae bacterium]